MTDHTPTPWKALDQYIMDDNGAVPIASGHIEWATGTHGTHHDTAKANAAFIVRAVNAHDDLVSTSNALITGLELLVDLLGIDDSTSILIRKVSGLEVIAEVTLATIISNSKAALSKAGDENA